MNLKMIVAMFLFLNSFFVLADTYPVLTTPDLTGLTEKSWSTCGNPSLSVGENFYNSGGVYRTVAGSGSNLCPSGSTYVTSCYYNVFYTVCHTPITHTCPNGGTVSGPNCTNAPPCLSPSIRSPSSPYACFTPAECAYPETDNGFGVCEDISCPVGQNRNPVTKSCQIPPSCGSTQDYDSNTNTCYLKKLACPGHTHANTANDICLPDAPLACPGGQHDNGTYECVADDAAHCSSGQIGGTIDGVYQCVRNPDLDKERDEAIQAANEARAADDLAKTAQDECAAATAFWNENVSNEARRIEASNKCSQAQVSAQTATAADRTANSKAETAQLSSSVATSNSSSATSKSTNSMDNKLTEISDSIKGTGLNTNVPVNDGSAFEAALNPGGSTFGTSEIDYMSFVDAVDFDPNSTSCQGVQMSYRWLNYTFNPCDKLALWRNLMGWFCYIYTVFSIIQLARKVD